MSDNQPSPGPSRQTLAGLLGSMKTYMKAKDAGIRIAKGKVKQVLRPRKFCKLCGRTWDRVFIDPSDSDNEMTAEICENCGKMLQDGFVAVVSSKEPQPIWMRASGDLSEYAGSVMHVSHEVYAAALARFKELERENKSKTDNGEQQQPQSN